MANEGFDLYLIRVVPQCVCRAVIVIKANLCAQVGKVQNMLFRGSSCSKIRQGGIHRFHRGGKQRDWIRSNREPKLFEFFGRKDGCLPALKHICHVNTFD